MAGKKMKFAWPEAGHDKHLCYLVNMRWHSKHMTAYAEMVSEAGYVCEHCGRAAKEKGRLCRPTKI